MKLANIYIMNQEFEPNLDYLKSLSLGSGWENLYIPYKSPNKILNNNLLNNIMALRFMIIELSLYIDTHPTNKDALNCYAKLKREYNDMLKKYGDIDVEL